jgi:hypothetical protein
MIFASELSRARHYSRIFVFVVLLARQVFRDYGGRHPGFTTVIVPTFAKDGADKQSNRVGYRFDRSSTILTA